MCTPEEIELRKKNQTTIVGAYRQVSRSLFASSWKPRSAFSKEQGTFYGSKLLLLEFGG